MIRTIQAMGTFVTIHTVDADARPDVEHAACLDRAFDWFHQVETRCTRFDPDSEVMRLTTQVGTPVLASDILFETIGFAIAVAEASGGAFDPVVGHLLERRGFNRHHRTGASVHTAVDPAVPACYRDLRIDASRRTITALQPMVLDLGAVAKGLAIDLAARELRPLANFAIDAGGDLYLAGRGPGGAPWTVGIRHPREAGAIVHSVTVSEAAVCTSGDYERQAADGGHHLLDPRNGLNADAVASATVIAPTAMAADALGTAAFVLGPVAGVRFLERHGVEGLLVSAAMERHATRGFDTAFGGAAILRNAQRSTAHRAADPGRARRGARRRQPDRARTA